MGGTGALSSKIHEYAKTHLSELKKEEQVTGRKFTEYDVAQIMLKKGAITQKEFSVWSYSTEGSVSKSQSEYLKRGGAIFNLANGAPSYLESFNDDPNRIWGFQAGAKPVKKFNLQVKENKFKAHIKSLPNVEMSYKELINSIKFDKMSESEKTEALLEKTGELYYEAQKKGDKKAMKEALLEGFSLTFAVMDDKLGINDAKKVAKKLSGLD